MQTSKSRIKLLLQKLFLFSNVLAFICLIAGCGPKVQYIEWPSRMNDGSAKVALLPIAYQQLPGWHEDSMDNLLPTLLQSWQRIKASHMAGSVITDSWFSNFSEDWQPLLDQALALPADNAEKIREYFHNNFVPCRVIITQGNAPLFTGYYEPIIEVASSMHDEYKHPIYSRPNELITIDDLSIFLGEKQYKNKRIAGRVQKGKLVPYYTRTEIEQGILAGRNLEIAWAKNPVDLFFLHVQGSGVLKFEDGSMVRIGYDGQNGHKYVSIGKVLSNQSAIPPEYITKQYIMGWMQAQPDSGMSLMQKNPAYVFFRLNYGDGPIGKHGAVLTPLRSVATDPIFISLGVPLWINAQTADKSFKLQRMVVAQDVGGVIKGPGRVDIFTGSGAGADELAGRLRANGETYILLPKTLLRKMIKRRV